MHTKRIIPCMDIQNGTVVKGVNFDNIKQLGDPLDLAKKYERENADELLLLDIAATAQNRAYLIDLVKKITKEIKIPVGVGGGINSVEIAREILQAGATKISVGAAAVQNPNLIRSLSRELGSQRLIIAIDTQKVKEEHRVFIKGGKEQTEWKTLDWAKKAEELGAGEILLTSITTDGTKNGFDLAVTALVSRSVTIPVIASGGAGNANDFIELFQKTQADAGLAASIFHLDQLSIPQLKQELKTHKIKVR